MPKTVEGLNLDFNDKYITCHILSLSDELKDCIRTHLQNICHGKGLMSKGLSAHSYARTLLNFRNRYDDKTDNIKKGMMGELLTHFVIHEFFESFDVVSPFFNMEEKSQRKGFDLILASDNGQNVWITEVKSGELNKIASPDSATSGFLHTAKRDLKNRLSQPEVMFWLNAINAVSLAISGCTDYKDAVIKILDLEASAAADNKASGKDNNVILVSVLFSDIENAFNSITTASVADNITGEQLFNKVITFSIQKSTYQRIEHFLFTDELNEI